MKLAKQAQKERLKMRIKTFARVRGRPISHEREGSCLRLYDKEGVVQVHGQKSTYKFAFDQVFGASCDQAQVYEEAVSGLVDSSLDGLNGTVFAYGQTGSGKTYTITGGATYETRGVIPRALSQLFQDRRLVSCRVSYVEVYNEDVFDLLNNREKVSVFAVDTHATEQEAVKGKAGGGWKGKRISGTKVHMKNLTRCKVATEEDALDLFFAGSQMRSIGSTTLNINSSRSHCLFMIEVLSAHNVGILNFVDLAGSERTSDSHGPDNTSKYINLSLHFLEHVVMSLQNRGSKQQQRHVGFRNSTMTALLRESLDGNCQSSFLITLNPHPGHVGETLSSCRFAVRCRSLTTRVVANETLEQKIDRLEQENRQLRQSLENAFGELKEHTKLQETLNGILATMHNDCCEMISCEASFMRNIDVQVDIAAEVVIATNSMTMRSARISRASIMALERCRGASGTSIFRIFGAAPVSSRLFGKNAVTILGDPITCNLPRSTAEANQLAGLTVILELEYVTDASMAEQVAWLQSFEHWLGPEIQVDEPIDDEEEDNQWMEQEGKIPERPRSGSLGRLKKALTSIRTPSLNIVGRTKKPTVV